MIVIGMKRILFAAVAALSAALALGQPSEDATRKKLLEVAFKYRGVPYMYGAESPRAFDCSGFVRYVYREAFGIELPRSARGFFSAGTPIDWKAAKPGDVFVYDTVGGAPSHVSIVVGDGTVIHAVSEGPRTGVIVSPLSDKYWAPRLMAARSFLARGASQAGSADAAKPAASAKPAAAALAPGKGTGTTAAASKPTPQTARAEPETAPEAAVVDIGLSIPREKASFADRIPTVAGTSVAFTIANDTGEGGSFLVLFFRIDPKTYKLQQIHEEKVRLTAGGTWSLPPYRFGDAGKYKLVVKDSWGNQRLERTFTVAGSEG